jgi:hypothetical protein
MKRLFFVAALVAWLVPVSARADVQLTIANGRVSLTARNATPQQILAEWARVGQTKVVNVERVPGAPMTLELVDVPEQTALDIVLRSISGYLAAPRSGFVANASAFDRIIVMPTPATARPRTAATPAPVAGQPRGDDQPEEPFRMPQPNAVQLPPRPPVFNAFPYTENGQQPGAVQQPFPPQNAAPFGQPNQAPFPPPQPGAAPFAQPAGQAPPAVQAPTATPVVPQGTAAPGMIVQPPQPTQPGPNGQAPPQQQ